MAEVPLSVVVSANLDELRARMREAVLEVGTTETAMKKMANSFDGASIIANANAAVLQVEKLGGVTSLTSAEQARLNTTLTEALAKYQALGREAPAGMQKLADETKQADVASGGLMDTVKSLAVSFAAMFTARAAFNFVKDTINEASALRDLSMQTHISIEEIQRLAGGMSEFGVDADVLAKGLYTLSRKIAHGDDSVAQALGVMGLSLQDVAGLHGEELFLKIEHGLATLQGGLRDDTSSEIFGARLGMAMAGASEGIEGALATWRDLNTVASTESVVALDQYGEAITRLEKSLGGLATNMMGPVAEGFNMVIDAATKAGTLSTFWAMMKDGAGNNGPLSAWIFGTDNLATVLDKANVAVAHATALARENTIATHAAAAAVTGNADAYAAMNAIVQTVLDDTTGEYQHMSDVVQTELDSKVTPAVQKVTDATDVWRSSAKFTTEVIGQLADETDRAAREAVKAAEKLQEAHDKMMAMGGSTDYGKPGGQGQDPAVVSLLHDGYSLAQAAAIAYALKMGFPVDMNSALFQQKGPRVPGYAEGVENAPGGWSMVGERGPELMYVPPAANIYPSGSGGGASTVHVYVSGVWDARSKRELTEAVSEGVMARQFATGQRMPVGA